MIISFIFGSLRALLSSNVQFILRYGAKRNWWEILLLYFTMNLLCMMRYVYLSSSIYYNQLMMNSHLNDNITQFLLSL